MNKKNSFGSVPNIIKKLETAKIADKIFKWIFIFLPK